MITATTDGTGVVSHAGSRLLANVADRTTLTARLAEALAVLRKPRVPHDPQLLATVGNLVLKVAVDVSC